MIRSIAWLRHKAGRIGRRRIGIWIGALALAVIALTLLF